MCRLKILYKGKKTMKLKSNIFQIQQKDMKFKNLGKTMVK
jgi:hypothetical protein